jgi:hypothetical protein
MRRRRTDMTLDEMKKTAIERVTKENLGYTDFKVKNVYENVMDGTVIQVRFEDTSRKEDSNHVHFGRDETRVYRWAGEVLQAVGNYRERNWFFRLLEMAGIGGVLALLLIVIFSALLCVLAFSPTPNASVIEVVKLSFSIILGYFFGQASGKR